MILVLAPAVSALFVSWHDPSAGTSILCSFFSVTEQIAVGKPLARILARFSSARVSEGGKRQQEGDFVKG